MLKPINVTVDKAFLIRCAPLKFVQIFWTLKMLKACNCVPAPRTRLPGASPVSVGVCHCHVENRPMIPVGSTFLTLKKGFDAVSM